MPLVMEAVDSTLEMPCSWAVARERRRVVVRSFIETILALKYWFEECWGVR
jgi:hypothetical protein